MFFILILNLIELSKKSITLLNRIVILLNTICKVLLLAARNGIDRQLLSAILAELVQIKEGVLQLSNGQKTELETTEDALHDSKYAESRIGVSEKTIYRLTQRGMLPIDSYQNGKKQFRSSDIERCRRFYRGGD